MDPNPRTCIPRVDRWLGLSTNMIVMVSFCALFPCLSLGWSIDLLSKVPLSCFEGRNVATSLQYGFYLLDVQIIFIGDILIIIFPFRGTGLWGAYLYVRSLQWPFESCPSLYTRANGRHRGCKGLRRCPGSSLRVFLQLLSSLGHYCPWRHPPLIWI